MNFFKQFLFRIRNQKGAVAVIFAIALIVLVSLAAMSIDVGHLMVARNELQNAADAGALAGALALFDDNTGNLDAGANDVAAGVATANRSENTAVETIYDAAANTGDIERGHWNPLDKAFTPNSSTVLVDLWDVDTNTLYNDTNFINAVRTKVKREATPIASFFAKIFGNDSFTGNAEAIAFIGFAGEIQPQEVDQPIAICKQSLKVDDSYSCNIGRMLNSGGNENTSNTGGWTTYEMADDSCSAANASELSEIVGCGAEGNPEIITLGDPIQATGGVQDTTFMKLRDCWWPPGPPKAPQPTTPWQLTLPVVDCEGNNVGNCPVVVGAVTVDLIWMTESGNPNPDKDAPGVNGEDMVVTRFEDNESYDITWDYENTACGDPNKPCCTAFKNQIGLNTSDACANLAGLGYPGFCDNARWQGNPKYKDGMARWDCFVNTFNLRNVTDGSRAPLALKSIYFLPSCVPHLPAGRTGGENFGVLAQYPALVK